MHSLACYANSAGALSFLFDTKLLQGHIYQEKYIRSQPQQFGHLSFNDVLCFK